MKKITKKELTKLWKLENSSWSVLNNISQTSWATEMYFTFLERIFYNKQLCKSAKSSKTIFYTWYTPKHQSNFFCTSLYNSPYYLWLCLTIGHIHFKISNSDPWFLQGENDTKNQIMHKWYSLLACTTRYGYEMRSLIKSLQTW